MRRQHGFTVIEVMLFLGVASLLVAGLLSGMGGAIQQQQYRDAVYSFAGFLRSQYSKVTHVENDRASIDKCPLHSSTAPNTNPGQSECVIVGRYITATDGGKTFQARILYAVKKNSNYWIYGMDNKQLEEYKLDWQVKTKLAGTSTDGSLSIIMYRHPETGDISIGTENKSNLSNDEIKNLSVDFTTQREICVYDDGWLSGQRQSIFLSPYAGSDQSINIKSATGGCNG